MNNNQQVDIFCRVVDNYGDIGVCWRLAQQLQQHMPVRLFVDDLPTFSCISSTIIPTLTQQQCNGITIYAWDIAEQVIPATLVIEAFGCDLADAYTNRMPGHTELWLNVEYLSAEDWVEDMHGLPSIQKNGINKHFFFPGFTTKTGGLLRPINWPNSSLPNDELWGKLGLITPKTECLAFVFPYPNAPLETLYEALSQHQQRWTILLTATAPKPISTWPKLHFQRLPFIDQADFDILLQAADFSIVRGEDSFVRAIWAAKPFIWQPYLQDEQTHLIKLDAWLKHSLFDAATQQVIRDWSNSSIQTQALVDRLDQLPLWQKQCQSYAHQLSLQDDLVTQLLAFYSQMRQKAVK